MDPSSIDQKHSVEAIEDPMSPKFQVFETENIAGKDRAAELLQNSHERIVVSETDNKRLLRKIDLMLLPIMLGVYFLQQLDKSTLSYASVFGLIKDAHLVGQDYSVTIPFHCPSSSRSFIYALSGPPAKFHIFPEDSAPDPSMNLC